MSKFICLRSVELDPFLRDTPASDKCFGAVLRDFQR
jgi:hypothetical protein